VVCNVKWIPPAGSLAGKSNDWITTPFLRPLKPFSVTFFVGREIFETEIPSALTT
jgi:hypothetical protein